MDALATTRRRRLDLPAIALVALVVAVAACLLAWKWSESASRQRCISDLKVTMDAIAIGCVRDEWSSEWPFHNVESVFYIVLAGRGYSHDVVRRLRKAFPGVPIYYLSDTDQLRDQRRDYAESPDDLVKLPEDED